MSLTDPYDADSDDDGMNDGDEIANGTNPFQGEVYVVFDARLPSDADTKSGRRRFPGRSRYVLCR